MRIKPFPVIMLGRDYWGPLVSWIEDTMLGKFGMISPGDRNLFQLVDDPEEAVRLIKRIVIV
jgi:predicted Rossmann-fold nucleotide-binding protein